MQPNALIKARLVISSGSVKPDEISAIVGVLPTKTWLQGQPVSRAAKNRYEENGWLLVETNRDNEASPISHAIDRLLSRIPVKNLRMLRDTWGNAISIELSLVVHFQILEGSPSIELTESHIDYLYNCGGTFDLDLYPS